jgi:DNA repair protein RecO (recombination protein O)
MDWSDEGIVVARRALGETSVVLELLTREHGRHAGLVRGGRSRRLRPVLQLGNVVAATWRGRLAEHLGTLTVELDKPYASLLIEDAMALSGLTSLCEFARLLPERDPHRSLYDAFRLILEHSGDASVWPVLLVRWELELLSELGFGLDFSGCAVTGGSENLTHVSPKSGRAVSAEAAEPYQDRLLVLPAFLTEARDKDVSGRDILNGFALTGFFLEKHALEPRGLMLPGARQRLIDRLQKSV